MLMEAFFPALYSSLGVFISLIVVNCIVLGRAEAYASKNKPVDSIIDGVSMALGYTMALLIISLVREVLGKGSITIWGSLSLDLSGLFNFLGITTIPLFTQPAGAFLTLGFIFAILAAINNKKEKGAAKK